MAQSKEAKEYFDVLLIGKTGMGKSSTGKKLLKIGNESGKESTIKQWASKIVHLLKITNDDEKPDFVTGDGTSRDSVTKQCQLLSNEAAKVRVLDVPGFADTDKAFEMGVVEANLELFRWILRIQVEFQLSFDRVLYFYPQRGAPEKADGNIQEEIKIMNYFFGSALFESMVIIATNHPRKQRFEFDEQDVTDMNVCFMRSLNLATRNEKSIARCPPVVYIGLLEPGEEILTKLRAAHVINPHGLIFKFVDSVCSKCAVRIRYAEHKVHHGNRPRELVGVTNSKGEFLEYNKSLCHPIIIPRYTRLEKVLGGIVHITTLGLMYLYEKAYSVETLPGLFNSEEICPSCQKAPGQPGCTTVCTRCTVAWNGSPIDLPVNHTNELEELEISTESHVDLIQTDASTTDDEKTSDSTSNSEEETYEDCKG